MFRKLCGDSTLKNVILATTMWELAPPDKSQSHENELSSKFFKPALDKGAQMVRHYNTPQSAHDVVRKIVKNSRVVLQIQHEMVKQGKPIGRTGAGEAVNKESLEQSKRHEAELVKIREEMAQALKEKDEEGRRELEEAKAALQEQMKRLEQDREEMAAKYAAERARMEAWMRVMERKVKNRPSTATMVPLYEWVPELSHWRVFLICGFRTSDNRKKTGGAFPPRDPRHGKGSRNLYNPPPPRVIASGNEDLPPVMIACVPGSPLSC